MGKQKQQTISRFFARKPETSTPSSDSPSSIPSPAPKVSATVSFSPSKRKTLSSTVTSKSSLYKKPKTLDLPPFNPSLHQKFLQRLLEPPSPESLARKSTFQTPKFTPLEQQVVELKTKYPDVLLMVEVGYRYRFFGEDAEIAAKVLGIIAHIDHNFLTASIPTFRLHFHVRRLVSAGYKVGVVKQTETAAIKSHGSNRLGPFSRGLSALYTKATIEAAEDIGCGWGEGESCEVLGSNYLVCVVEKDVLVESKDCSFDVNIGLVGVEISTGEVMFGEFNDNVIRSGLEAVISSLSPAEILLGEPLSTQTEKGIMALPELVVQALALTIRYLKQFGYERILCWGALYRPFSSNLEMSLSANTLQQLEILKNNSDGSESGSLLQAMNHTSTAFGSRLLRHWVTHPLCDRNSICARLDAVSEFAESMGPHTALHNVVELVDEFPGGPQLDYLLASVLATLGKSPDVQRGITRIFHRTASAAEFVAVLHAILSAGKQLQQLHLEDHDYNVRVRGKIVRSSLLKRLILTASSHAVTDHSAKLLSSLNREAANQGNLQDLFIVSNNQFLEVGKARVALQITTEKLDSLIGVYRKLLGMSSLEFLSVSGYTHLIELPIDVKVPSNWVKINSTKKTIRYHPPEVLKALDELLLAKEELSVTCKSTWDSFLMGFGGHYAEFKAAVQALAALDCLRSLAILSRNRNYVRPAFVDDDEPCQICIHSGRHPVLESLLQDNFVPNDTYLHANDEYCQIVTGPNMGGKSCYIRQVALISIMAQVGSFVPATSTKLHVLDGVYTRMGSSDAIQQGRSTFFEELSEASQILQCCSSRSLVIIDELGRGTSTHDGVAIAYATLHHLIKQKKCMVLFVTHYPKIVDIKDEFPGAVGAYHVSYLTSRSTLQLTDSESDCSAENFDHGDVTFLYKVVPGISDKSFGFNVARLAQLPSSCIARAAVVSAKLEAEVGTGVGIRLAQTMQQETPVYTIENQEQQNCLDLPQLSSREQLCSSLCNGNKASDQLTRSCCEVFIYLQSAFSDPDPVKRLCSLKDARKLAQKIISWYEINLLH